MAELTKDQVIKEWFDHSEKLARTVAEGFTEVRSALGNVNQRLDAVDQRFDNLETYVDRRFTGVEVSVGRQFDEFREFIDSRFGRVITWMNAMEEWTESIDKRFDALEQSIRRIESQ